MARRHGRHRRSRDAAHLQLRARHGCGGRPATGGSGHERLGPCRRNGGEAWRGRAGGQRRARRRGRASGPGMVTPMRRRRAAVLISGRGSNMAALIEAAQAPDYPAEIALVVSNRAAAAGLKIAAAAGIATSVVEHSRYGTDREAFERDVQEVLDARGVELVCLAGFMRLLTPWF